MMLFGEFWEVGGVERGIDWEVGCCPCWCCGDGWRVLERWGAFHCGFGGLLQCSQ
jgi:hypothetical protein